MTHRKICPKDWLFSRIATERGDIFYKKVRKLNQYSYGIYVPSFIKSNFKIEKFDQFSFPIEFTAKIIKESKSYSYVIIPYEIVQFMHLREGDIINYNFGTKFFFGELRRGCNSLKLTIPGSIKEIRKYPKITINRRLKLNNALNKVSLHQIRGNSCFKLRSLLPKSTSRDGIDFKTFELDENKLLVCAKFKHVKGNSFKYLILPRYVDANKIALFFGLMHSDGSKKFGYPEVYGKHIFSPVLNFTNGDPHVVDLFLSLSEQLFNIGRKDFTGGIKYPLSLDECKKEKLKDFWYRNTKVRLKIYQDTKREKRWCPAGIANVSLYDILIAEIVISCLKKFIHWTKKEGVGHRDLKKNFIKGVFIGDGSPILDRGFLRRVMIAIEFKEEGEIYKEMLFSLGFKSRNLWNQKTSNFSQPGSRMLDIQGNTEFLDSLLRNFSFGFLDNGKFYGSLEKQYRFISGALRLTKLKDKERLEKEARELERYLRDYINDLQSFLPIPKFYERLINAE